MLVLTRKLMEKLYIGDNICVTVVRVEGGQVRLGIDAPREISVIRAELLAGRIPQGPANHQSLGSASDTIEFPIPIPIKLPPPSEPRGIDIRRRGPSR